ncbi:hypothetical protein KKB40_04645 [Patescibacteria group bacterium]|nr:hypothetical protein [Patescibacteria group bacterium]
MKVIKNNKVITNMTNSIVVKPKKDFWLLENSLSSRVKLSNSDLKKARNKFEKSWSKNQI